MATAGATRRSSTGMRRAVAARAVLALLLLAAVLLTAAPAGAQDQPSQEAPSQDIVPKPDSGTPPEEAGDRGGALQLMLPVLILGAIGFGAWNISRQARSRSAAPLPPSGGRRDPDGDAAA